MLQLWPNMTSEAGHVALVSTDASSQAWLERWGSHTLVIQALLSVLLDRAGTLRPYSADTAGAYETLAHVCGVDADAVDKSVLVASGLLVDTGLLAGLRITSVSGNNSTAAAQLWLSLGMAALMASARIREPPSPEPPKASLFVVDPPFGLGQTGQSAGFEPVSRRWVSHHAGIAHHQTMITCMNLGMNSICNLQQSPLSDTRGGAGSLL
jgi:hypothetical protein